MQKKRKILSYKYEKRRWQKKYFGVFFLCFFFSTHFLFLVNSAKAENTVSSIENQFLWLFGASMMLFFLAMALLCFYFIRKNILQDLSDSALLKQQLDLYKNLHNNGLQIDIIWQDNKSAPQIIGHLTALEAFKIDENKILDFPIWLQDADCQPLENNIEALKNHAQKFESHLHGRDNSLYWIKGQAFGAFVKVTIQNITYQADKFAALTQELANTQTILNIQQEIFNKISTPFWIYNQKNEIIFKNTAFNQAAAHEEYNDNVLFLFNEAMREKIKNSGPYFQGAAHAIIDGERHLFDITKIKKHGLTAIYAKDSTDIANLNDEMARLSRSHSETLDQISTAVAIFDKDKKLRFANQAFAQLWPLDTVFLESMPSHTVFLDRLREKAIIAEQPDWRKWKEQQFTAYNSGLSSQYIWHLPDGRILRVLANPHPQGGVTWLFENLTEQITLERRYNRLIKMQGETLDHLSEGVAVFSADGRVHLSNPAFTKIWEAPAGLVVEGTHIAKIEAHCQTKTKQNIWQNFTNFVTGFAEIRDDLIGRIDLLNGNVLDYALVPLPDAQTMMTFVNVTDTVNISRALSEKNEALESADRLRNDFVKNISYQFRTPLTNIIGFSQLLDNGIYGGLNQNQHATLKDITSESEKLADIVDDILDLATVDAGIMELAYKKLNIASIMEEAVSRCQELLGERPVVITTEIAKNLHEIEADAGRLRQIFINLLSNAANFAPDKSAIIFKAEKKQHQIIFSVHDEGCGIPKEMIDDVFKRFSSHSHNGARAGAGLGLSIVKAFVELHGGTVKITSKMGKGTTIYCIFPEQPTNAVLTN